MTDEKTEIALLRSELERLRQDMRTATAAIVEAILRPRVLERDALDRPIRAVPEGGGSND